MQACSQETRVSGCTGREALWNISFRTGNASMQLACLLWWDRMESELQQEPPATGSRGWGLQAAEPAAETRLRAGLTRQALSVCCTMHLATLPCVILAAHRLLNLASL